MSDTSHAFVASGPIPPSPPPATSSGPAGWVRENLFAGPVNSAVTVILIAMLLWYLPGIISWAFIDSVWFASSLAECREINRHGACWAVIVERFDQFIYGFYPPELRWRPNLAFGLMLIAFAYALFEWMPARSYGLVFAAVFPIIAYFLIWGGLGLEPVSSDQLGGFLLATIIGVAGIVLSLPIGILLALGRRSGLIFIQVICITFIEFIRGVPLITLLFVANSVLAYFFPPGSNLDLILRVVIMVTAFASAYMAEVIRGGLAALPSGQYEAADAMGLNYWQSMRLIILPQALKISIPNIVSTFIGLFKDTTLVVVIGLLDPIGLINTTRADSNWNGIIWEFYVFVGLFFFIACFAMSRYSLYLERKLATDRR
ncbi:MAG: amino acid ABC transporter permease [Pseudomonadota bacterium]